MGTRRIATDIGRIPERRKPLSFHRPLTERADVMGFNETARRACRR